MSMTAVPPIFFPPADRPIAASSACAHSLARTSTMPPKPPTPTPFFLSKGALDQVRCHSKSASKVPALRKRLPAALEISIESFFS